MSSKRSTRAIALLASLTLHAGLLGAIAWWRIMTPPTVFVGGSGAGSAESDLSGDAGDPAPEVAMPSLGAAGTPSSSDSLIASGPSAEAIIVADAWSNSGNPTALEAAGVGSFGLPTGDLTVPQAMPSHSESRGQGGAGGGDPAPLAGNAPPVYPTEAKRRRWEGTVRLKLIVTADGSVRDVEVEESSGYEILDKAAIKGVREWRFNPATVDGAPVEAIARVPINFVLKV